MKRGKKIKIPIIACLLLLTATILAAVTITTIQNQNQSAYSFISAYLQGVSQSPNNIIRPKMDVNSSITLNGGVYTETINVLADNIVIDGNGSTIQGTGPGTGTGYGVDLNGRSNVTIFNVTATGWDSGFYISGYSNNLFDNTANNNVNGFYLIGSYNNFTHNYANNNYFAGFYLEYSSNNNLTNNIVINNCLGFYLYEVSSYNNLSGNTALNSTGYYWSGDSRYNDFTGSVWANYLRVNVTDALGFPIEGADVGVVTQGGTLIYSSGWTNYAGVTQWFVVPYRTFTGPTTMTNEYTTVLVGYQGFPIENNYRPVVMSNSHVETFRVIDNSDPVVAIMFPASNSTVNTSVIWIMGTFDGTGSQLTNITINDSRFTLLEPLGPPFGLTGTFRFIASGIGTSEFDIEVTVQDGTGRVATATRHIVVVVQQPSSPSEGFSVPLAMLSALMLSSAQGGVSPMIYTAVGAVAGVGVAAAVLFYYFRRSV